MRFHKLVDGSGIVRILLTIDSLQVYIGFCVPTCHQTKRNWFLFENKKRAENYNNSNQGWKEPNDAPIFVIAIT